MNELEDDDKLPDEEVEVVETEEAQAEKREAVPPEFGIEALRKQLDEANAAKAEAERRAAQAENDAYSARTDQHDSNVQLVEGAIKTMTRESEILLAAIKEAKASGDTDRETELTSELWDTKSKLGKLEEGLDALKGKTLEKPKPVPPSDPVEALASQLSPKSAAWVRAHPECVSTQKMYNKMLAAHNLAVSNDLEPDTPEYFAALETTMGFNKPVVQEKQEEVVSEASKAVTREAPQVAPVTRGGNGNATRVTLSAAEREIAEMLGMKAEDYAKNKVALQKAGRIGSVTH